MRKARLLAEHTGHYHVILKATGPQFLFRAARLASMTGLLMVLYFPVVEDCQQFIRNG